MSSALKPTEWRDRRERLWDMEMNLGIALSIDRSDFKEQTPLEFSILELGKELQGELVRNRALLVALGWVVCRRQAIEKFKKGDFPVDPNIDEESAQYAFMEAMNGDTFLKFREAFWRGLIDFFPERRTSLETMRQKIQEMERKIEAEVATIMPEMDRVVDATIARTTAELRAKLLKIERGQPSIESPVSSELQSIVSEAFPSENSSSSTIPVSSPSGIGQAS